MHGHRSNAECAAATHLLSNVQFPRHTVVREIGTGRRRQKLRSCLSIIVLQRRLYSGLGTAVDELGPGRLICDVVWLLTVAVGYRVPEHGVLVVFAGHRLYGCWRTSSAVLFPVRTWGISCVVLKKTPSSETPKKFLGSAFTYGDAIVSLLPPHECMEISGRRVLRRSA